jgi:hypothetical protein
LHVLGVVPPDALQAFGWPDMGITAYLRQDFSMAMAAIRQQVLRYRPDVIVLPALADRHPDHGAAHVLLRLALAEHIEVPNLLAYLVHGQPGGPLVERIRIDMTAHQRSTKLVAVAEHHSQMALSAARMRQWAGGDECFESVEPVKGQGSERLLPWKPWPLLMPWLRLTLIGRGGVHYWRWREAPLVRDAAGRYILHLPAGLDGQGPLFVKMELDLPSPWIFDHWGWQEL